METSLTEGAIEKIINGEMTPVLQVTELKLIKAQQDPTKERFKMLLSDGTHLLQGILGTEPTNLVKSGTLQSGSIVRLTHFVGCLVATRRFVIVMQLDVIKSCSDIIGHPVPAKPDENRVADSGVKLNKSGSGRSESNGVYQVNNTETGRSTCSSVPASTVPTRAYNNPSAGHGFKQDQACDPPTRSCLTAGAIEKIMSGEVTSEREMTPVLQVTELKLLKAQDPTKERFSVLLSDGTHLQQGMLGTQLNNLVKSGTLQSGSIVRLTHFLGNAIHNRRIVIVMQLDVIKACSDIIGHPVHGGKPNEKRGADSGVKLNTTGSGRSESTGVYQVNNTETGRSTAAISPQVGQKQVFTTGSSVPASTVPIRAYNNPSAGHGFKQDQACDPPTRSCLTAGAIEKIMSGEVTSEREMTPVLQVTELKLIKAQQDPKKERFMVLLSDGTHLHQDTMLGTQLNNLVKSGTLQSGSIVRLTHFVGNAIHNRRIVMLMQLDVIKACSDIIGHPVLAKPNEKREAYSGVKLNSTGSEQHGRSESTGVYQVNNTETGRSTAAISPQVGQKQVFTTGSSVPASTVPTRAYNNPSAGHGFWQDQARDPPTRSCLTAGAIEKIMSGEVTSERDMIPVLQVTEFKLIKAQQDPTKERLRMLLSDGTHLHQGMLGTELNNLVKSGTLQSGSIVRLTQFVGTVIHGRRIVVVVQLDVIKSCSDIIGHPVHGGKPNEKCGADSGVKLNSTGSEQHGRSESNGGYQLNNTETGRSNTVISPQVGQRQVFSTGSSVPASTVPTRAYSNPSAGHRFRQDQARDPPTRSCLTAGAIEKIMSGEVTSEREMTPVLRVTELKLIKGQQDPTKERFRMLLSDGTHLHQDTMLGIELNNLVKSGTLQSGSIVRLTRFAGNVIQGRSIVVVMQLDVIKSQSDDIIGHLVPGGEPIEKRLADLSLS